MANSAPNVVITTQAQRVLDAHPKRAAALQQILQSYTNATSLWVGIRRSRKVTLSVTVVLNHDVPHTYVRPKGFEVHIQGPTRSASGSARKSSRGNAGYSKARHDLRAEGVLDDLMPVFSKVVSASTLQEWDLMSAERVYLLSKGVL